MEISKFLDKEFKVTVTKKLAELGRMNEHSENFNKEMENIRNIKHWDTFFKKNTVFEIQSVFFTCNTP